MQILEQLPEEYFRIDHYDFDEENYQAKFYYSQVGGKIDSGESLDFCETVHFVKPSLERINAIRADFNYQIQLNYALTLATFLIGTSYYKTRPTKAIIADNLFWSNQTDLFEYAYQEGLSQFAYENHLTRADLATLYINPVAILDRIMPGPRPFSGRGNLALQSGGKDSILTASLLNEKNLPWTALYISSNGNSHPEVIDQLGAKKVQVVERNIDTKKLEESSAQGGLNGHVPVTYINMAIALVQAIINGDNEIITSIGHEGEEPHTVIKSPIESGLRDLPVNHQWSKTWQAEQLFSKFVSDFISTDIKVGSLLRQYSELKIAELFAERCWEKYNKSFSSCNQSNYRQGKDNSKLHWCGKCAKCANSYLLFAPFISAKNLNSVIANKNGSLFQDIEMANIFKGLLGIDDQIKPFECVGEITELRCAYHLKQPDYPDLPFDVPQSGYDYSQTYLHQNLGI